MFDGVPPTTMQYHLIRLFPRSKPSNMPMHGKDYCLRKRLVDPMGINMAFLILPLFKE